MPSRAPTNALIAALLTSGLTAAGCESTTGPRTPTGPQRITAAGPFAPTLVRIHPLTHFDTGPDGAPRVVVHLEFEDAWADPVKAAGDLTIRLHPAGRPADADAPAWDIPLRDLGLNARLFTPATRTYRVILGQLPAWAIPPAQPNPRPAAAKPAIRIEAVFRGVEGDTATALRDEYTLRPD